jgi:hypothetical protein
MGKIDQNQNNPEFEDAGDMCACLASTGRGLEVTVSG